MRRNPPLLLVQKTSLTCDKFQYDFQIMIYPENLRIDQELIRRNLVWIFDITTLLSTSFYLEKKSATYEGHDGCEIKHSMVESGSIAQCMK